LLAGGGPEIDNDGFLAEVKRRREHAYTASDRAHQSHSYVVNGKRYRTRIEALEAAYKYHGVDHYSVKQLRRMARTLRLDKDN
jgi:hypothetical protein